MEDIKQPIANTCKYCDNIIHQNDFYNIYRVIAVTNKQLHYIGLQKILDELDSFAMEQGYHLSASQLILLRPDIVKVFLSKKIANETVLFYFLQESEICFKCYNEEYINMIPLK